MAKTNNEILLEYLQAGNIVTTRNAPDELGIADVRANIRDLRDLGYEILEVTRISQNITSAFDLDNVAKICEDAAILSTVFVPLNTSSTKPSTGIVPLVSCKIRCNDLISAI